LVPSETDSVSLFSLLKNKTKEERKRKKERKRWVAFWVDAHFEMYTMGARACVVEQRTQVVWVRCCCHKVEFTEGFCTQHQHQPMCRLFGRRVKMCIKNIKGLLLRHTLI
jgi:hypothetical protein